MIVTRFGHAALLVEDGDTRILIDPGSYSVEATFELDGLAAIVVTHQHVDHVDPERLPRLLAASPEAVVLAEASTLDAVPAFAGRATAFGAGDVVRVGPVEVSGAGKRHATIHRDIPVVGNVGVVIAAPGGPRLFHPGDAYEAAPDGVDVLALPITAPWAKLGETVDFVRRVAPMVVLPIHDAALSPTGYPIYRRTIEGLGGAGRVAWLSPTESLPLD